MKKVLFLSGGKDGKDTKPPSKWLEGMSKRASAVGESMSAMGGALGSKLMTKPAPAADKGFDEGGDAAADAAGPTAGDAAAGDAAAADGEKKASMASSMMEGARKSLDTAGTKISGLMASMKPSEKAAAADDDGDKAADGGDAAPAADAPEAGRLAALKIAMAHLTKRAPTPEDQIAALKTEVADLKATVAALADKVAALEAKEEAV